MTEEKALQGWHIDKRLTVGHIVTTVVVAVSAIMYITAMERRLSVLEVKQDLFAKQQSEGLAKIDSHLVRIEAKLDRKVDR